ncbi:hypothetical protein CCR85_13295 [Rhodothalassium salexigens]|uniref:heavy metal-binding domain-containing protein n=1 Tax=Rhodothalassium salexigens TaxID=1086 RepID=UPI0019148682|nr:heavy metal-binding domain-containing protein [Rhodothalassium salexigens]MBK5912462.1 hypothetical protein [Rhodothalassium salexigens]
MTGAGFQALVCAALASPGWAAPAHPAASDAGWLALILPDTWWLGALGALALAGLLWAASLGLAWRHDRALDRHEATPGRPRLSTLPPPSTARTGALVWASVVQSHSASRMLWVLLRRLVGGEIGALAATVRRARREARRRLEHAARDAGCDAVYGLRFAGVGLRAGGIKTVEVIAYGTAVHSADRAEGPADEWPGEVR